MIIRAIRRITDDAHHNAFTGACWFKGNLYIAYRQAAEHGTDLGGHIVVLRSLDEGLTWTSVAVIRGPGDTRDAHLYTDGEQLFAVAFCICVKKADQSHSCRSGYAVSDNGDNWTNWTPYEGTDEFIMWRPAYHAGKHYCAAYIWRGDPPWGAVHWFESSDGRKWQKVREIHSGDEMPSECHLEILDNGRATMLMRCDTGALHPYLCTSEYPFKTWKKQKLTDITLVGAAVWTAGDDVYIGGRWCFEPETGTQYLERDHGSDNVAQIGIFRVEETRCVFQRVLPSGPWFDHSYLGIARHPLNSRRFAISFYSDAIAPSIGSVDQQHHPDIYWADTLFLRNAGFLRDGFMVSKRLPLPAGLSTVQCPDIKDTLMAFKELPAIPKTDFSGFPGQCDFLSLCDIIDGKSGVVYIVRDLPAEEGSNVRVHLGYDGPVKVWWNGAEVFSGPGVKPAIRDHTSLALESGSGVNRLTIALDTNGGTASGIFARWETV